MKQDIPSDIEDAGSLLRIVQPVHPTTPMLEVLERFISQESLYAIPVVEDQAPVGLVNRNRLIELFSKPFTRELYGRKPISDMMDAKPVVVPVSESIDDLARIIIDAGMQYMYDGFILTERSAYAGMGTGHDLLNAITERKQAHLYQLAHYDQLTGLPNRLLLLDRLTHACSQALRRETLVALLFIDLDRFKLVNDTHGHIVGDLLLKEIAVRLKSCLRKNDSVGRLGGDEFTVILEDIPRAEVAMRVANKILQTLSRPTKIERHELFVSASVGIAIFPFGDDTGETLIKKADAAMYSAKQRGRNCAQLFSWEMSAAVFERQRIENSLRYALERDEFEVHYQPLVELKTGVVVGLEALLRWSHPEMGLVSPDVFIPVAEECGLIHEIGGQVLRTACRQNRAWQHAGLPAVKVAVNLSACQMTPTLPRLVQTILDETGLEPRYLELELTENILLENIEESITILHQLSDMGVKASIDDFGTGYSSLNYLQRLPINTLKIDRSFLKAIQSSEDDSTIVATIIAMAHSMKLDVIAEGVETRCHLELLASHDCDYAQGYYFSRPCPAAAVADLLSHRYAITANTLQLEHG